MGWFSKQWEDLTTHGPGKAIIKAGEDVGKAAWKGTKQFASFQLNMMTLGAANKFTSVSKWSGTKHAGKWGTAVGIGGAAIIGGAYAGGLFTPAATAAGTTGVSSTGAGFFGMTSGELAADLAVAPIASGAGSAVTAGTVAGVTAASGGSGFWSALGLAGIGQSLFKAGGDVAGGAVDKLIERESNSMFGGSGGGAGGPGAGMGGFEGGGLLGGGMSMLPFILIGITLTGAFLLSKKGRKR